MTWLGPDLDPDHRDLLDMLDSFLADHDGELLDDDERTAALRAELAGLGIWTLGSAVEHGGGGADRLATTIAFERLGRRWPALGLASVHAHAAVDVLGPSEHDLVRALHAGNAQVAVLDAESEHARLTIDDDVVTGHIDRVDVTAVPAAVLLLGQPRVLLLESAALHAGPLLRRTGLGGARTTAIAVRGALGSTVHALDDVDVDAARGRLRLGAAAVAAGIAGSAAAAAHAYAATRQQFGGPLTALPTVRGSLFGQTTRVSSLLAAILTTRIEDAVATAGVIDAASSAAVDVAAAALQVHGGYGYLAEYTAERHVRDALSLQAATDAAGVATLAARAMAEPSTTDPVCQ